MGWKFWKKTAPGRSVNDISWPTDSYESARVLAGLFSTASGAAPFIWWRSPEAKLREEVVPVAEWGTKAMMIALWLWTFRDRHGDLAARMARDEFCLLLDELSSGFGRMTESLLSTIDSAREEFESKSEEQRTVQINGQAVRLPFHWYVSMALLVKMDDSPHAGRADADLGNDDTEVAMLLIPVRS